MPLLPCYVLSAIEIDKEILKLLKQWIDFFFNFQNL